MTIPDDLKIFSFIYEYRFFALVPLYALWIAGGFYFLFRLKKVFFLWLLIFPLVLSPLHIAFVYSGWHYRMELYDRFAKTPHGWHDIDCMPPAIRAEYATQLSSPFQRYESSGVRHSCSHSTAVCFGRIGIYGNYFDKNLAEPEEKS